MTFGNRATGRIRASSVCVVIATCVACATLGGAGIVAPGHASSDDIAINGRYRATSLGNWAKTNDAFHDQPTVASTWTISSSCSTAQDCTGRVSSDQGWDAPLSMNDGLMWYVKHDVPNWETCPDGSKFAGNQIFTFYAVDGKGDSVTVSPTLTGRDKTVGPSGACRVNKWLSVEMPFRLDKIS